MREAAADDATIDSEDESRAIIEQREFGFWLYLMSDAIIFALLFATYAVMARSAGPGAGIGEFVSLPRVAAETAVLLASSLSFGLASFALEKPDSKRAIVWLAVTFVLGGIFLALELSEFSGLIAAGAGPDRSGIFSAFFTLLGTHGLHVAMGLCWILILAVQLRLQGPSTNTLSRLRRLGLFWHFLDIVWIGIYSVVYLPALV
jgi:cytochrome o ubiquinol oxidase subunit 3